MSFTITLLIRIFSTKNKQKRLNIDISACLISVRERIRTPDTLVRSQVLYPAELHTHIIKFN